MSREFSERRPHAGIADAPGSERCESECASLTARSYGSAHAKERYAAAILLAGAVSLLAKPVWAGALAGDASRGETVYQACEDCHSLDKNDVGPRHRGVYGRKAGSLSDYDYSDDSRRTGGPTGNPSAPIGVAAPDSRSVAWRPSRMTGEQTRHRSHRRAALS